MGVDQVPTFLTTVEEIMASPYFVLGAADQRAGRGYRSAYTTWSVNNLWNYERGRAWAVLAPRSVALKRDGKLNPAAIDHVLPQGHHLSRQRDELAALHSITPSPASSARRGARLCFTARHSREAPVIGKGVVEPRHLFTPMA
jgi:hypothetical protein